MLQARQILRDGTAGLHERVDSAFGRFDLGEAASYAKFLSAHARILPTLEALVDARVTWPGWSPRMPALAADLAEIDMTTPPDLGYPLLESAGAGWGVLYVLEGSRLGGAMLARGVGPGLPKRYLSATHAKGSWLAFQAELELHATRGGNAWLESAIVAARDAFEGFEAAARIEMDVLFAPPHQ